MSKPIISGRNLSSPPRLIAVVSGRGGAGATFCAANIARLLAKDKRVLAVDLNFGRGNLHRTLGIQEIERSIYDFMEGDDVSLEAFKTETAIKGLSLIALPAASGRYSGLSSDQCGRLIESLQAEAVDYVVLDMGGGVSNDRLTLMAAANLRVFVTNAEFLANNGLEPIKYLAYRVMISSLETAGLDRERIDAFVTALYEKDAEKAGPFTRRRRKKEVLTAEVMRRALAAARVGVILNKARTGDEALLETSLQRIALRNPRLNLVELGSIPYDTNHGTNSDEDGGAHAAFAEVLHRMGLALADPSIEPAFDVNAQIAPMQIDIASAGSGGRGRIEQLAAIVRNTLSSVSNPFRARPSSLPEPAQAPILQLAAPPTRSPAALGNSFRPAERRTEAPLSAAPELTALTIPEHHETAVFVEPAQFLLELAAAENGWKVVSAAEPADSPSEGRVSSSAALVADTRLPDQKIALLESQIQELTQETNRVRKDHELALQGQQQQYEGVVAERDTRIADLLQELGWNHELLRLLQTHMKTAMKAALEDAREMRRIVEERNSRIAALELEQRARDRVAAGERRELPGRLHDAGATLKDASEPQTQLETINVERNAEMAAALRQNSDRKVFVNEPQEQHMVGVQAAAD